GEIFHVRPGDQGGNGDVAVGGHAEDLVVAHVGLQDLGFVAGGGEVGGTGGDQLGVAHDVAVAGLDLDVQAHRVEETERVGRDHLELGDGSLVVVPGDVGQRAEFGVGPAAFFVDHHRGPVGLIALGTCPARRGQQGDRGKAGGRTQRSNKGLCSGEHVLSVHQEGVCCDSCQKSSRRSTTVTSTSNS